MRSKFWDFNREIRIQLSRKRGAGRGPSFVLWWKLARVGCKWLLKQGLLARPGLLIRIRSRIGWDPNHLPYPDRDRHPRHAYPESSSNTVSMPNTSVLFRIKAQTLEKKCSNKLIFHIFWLVICKLMRIRIRFWIQLITLIQIQMRIRIVIFIWCGCECESGSGCGDRFLFDADADLDADPGH